MQLGKGNHETDVQLPIQLTCALNSQITKAGKEGSETDFPFEDYIVAQNMQNLFPSFLKQVTASRRYGEGPSNNNNEVPDPRSAMLGAKKEPHEVRLPEDLERWPNFDHPLFQGPCYLPLLGDVTLRVYDSEDGKCRFLFVEADDGRAFLAGVERLTSEINKYGVRSKYFQPSGADAPLVEYYCQTQADCRPKSEAPCYNTAIFNVGRKKDGRYISNWNFVRALPIIQEYYKARQEEIPDTV